MCSHMEKLFHKFSDHYVYHNKQLSVINKLITLLIIHANSLLHDLDHVT